MDAKKYKIGVVGMGPIGQVLAVHFQEAGCEVVVCDNDKDKMALIRKAGVKLEGKIKKSSFFNHAYTSLTEFRPHDLDMVFFCIKSTHTDHIGEEFKTLDNGKICAISAQNGIDIENKYSDVIGESRTLRIVLNFAGNLHSPNVVNVTFFNPPNFIASMDDSQEEMANWTAEILNSVSLVTEMSDSFSMIKKIWEKTILNAALSALCAISKLTMREAMSTADIIEIVEQTIIEAVEVAGKEDIRFCDNFVKICLRYLKKGGDHFPSLAVDFLNKRETEIDYFNGKIVEYGRKHYVRTPLNLTFTNLVKAATSKNKTFNIYQKVDPEMIL